MLVRCVDGVDHLFGTESRLIRETLLCIFTVLRPANEYNIKEKIKLANQESFAIPTPPSPKYLSGERRVTFRAQLVDYEPDEYSDVEEEGRYAATNGKFCD